MNDFFDLVKTFFVLGILLIFILITKNGSVLAQSCPNNCWSFNVSCQGTYSPGPPANPCIWNPVQIGKKATCTTSCKYTGYGPSTCDLITQKINNCPDVSVNCTPGSCVPQSGGGNPTNTPVPPTPTPTPYHLGCSGKNCVRVAGTGTNDCGALQSDAPACTHLGCSSGSCILKANSPGDTTNNCRDDNGGTGGQDCSCPGAAGCGTPIPPTNTPTPTPGDSCSSAGGVCRTTSCLAGETQIPGCTVNPGKVCCKPGTTVTNTPTPTPRTSSCVWPMHYITVKDCVSCGCFFHTECVSYGASGGNSATCTATGATNGTACNDPSNPYSITNTPSSSGFSVTLTTDPASRVGSGVPVTFTAKVSAVSPGDPKGGGMPSDLLYTFFWDCQTTSIGTCKPLSGSESNIIPDPGQCRSLSFGDVCRTTPTGTTDSVSRTHAYSITGSWYNAAVMAEKTPPQLCNGYGEACAVGCCSGLSCQPSSGSFPTCRYPGSDAETNAPIYVSCTGGPPVTDTPTPTPTPIGPVPWIKLVDTSFTGVSALNNPVPSDAKKFKGNAGDDPGNPVFIDSSNGSDPGVAVGPSINTGSSDVSSKKWKTEGVTFTPQIGVSSFISYLKSRKNYTDIPVTQDLKAGITSGNAIYVAEGNRTISDDGTINQDNQDNIVLIVVGDLTITKNKFNPSKHTVAILVTGDIILDPGVSELDGIFIVDGKVNAGGGTNGLEVVGNLIVKKGFTSNRSQTDNRYPSVLIKFDPSAYRSLLPYLSIRTYDWIQLLNK